MPYAYAMAVDRLSVTVPSELGEALRALAARRNTTVSDVVSEAIAHQIRLANLDLALAEADRRFGPVSPALLAEAEAELTGTPRPKQPRRKKR